MEVKIERIDPSLPIPEYHTKGAAGFDLYTRISATIPASDFLLLPTNLIIETPPGFMLMIAARSSSAKKKGLNMRNGVGIIDQDYSGPEDEIHLLVQNLTDADVHVEKGERLAQGIFVQIAQATFSEVKLEGKNRGGFGSTG